MGGQDERPETAALLSEEQVIGPLTAAATEREREALTYTHTHTGKPLSLAHLLCLSSPDLIKVNV